MVVIEPEKTDPQRFASIAQRVGKDLSYRINFRGICRLTVTINGLSRATKPVKGIR